MQESAVRPVGRWQPALRTPDRLVASAVRVEAPITVGDDLGHRQRLWPLPIERGDLRAQLLGLRELLRLHQLLYIGDGATTACEHLGRQQLLAWCPLGFGLEDRGLNVWRVLLLDVLGPHRFTRRRFDLRDAIAQRRNLVVNFLVGFGVRRCLRARCERHFDLDPSVDRGRETVVVVLPDRIELVVVATGAVDREAHHASAERGDQIVDVVPAALRVVLLAEQHARSHAKEAGRDQCFLRLPIHLVAGDLFCEEQVVRLVLIERVDYIVAVPPRVRPVVILLEAVRVGIARDVEPVTAPPRRRE